MEDVKTQTGSGTEGTKSPLDITQPSLNVEKELTPEEKLNKYIANYPFLEYANGILRVSHPECEALLTPKILKMGDLVKRGNYISSLNGGVSKPDEQTSVLNSCIATVQVGFDNLKLDLLSVSDDELILGLYTAVVGYNTFFRKTPLNFIL